MEKGIATITINDEPPKPTTFEDLGYVQVIRCKDCKFLIDHYGFMNDGYCANMRDKYCVKFKPDKDWFCADGERK